jgi:hypothetical protein
MLAPVARPALQCAHGDGAEAGELKQLGVDAPQLDLGLAGPQHRVDRHAQALVELGLKLEHLELLHQQLVIVRAYREALHNCASSRRARRHPRRPGSVARGGYGVGCRCRGGITPRSMSCSASSLPSSASACRRGRCAPTTRCSSCCATASTGSDPRRSPSTSASSSATSVRKVIAGQELLRASGTVTGKLVTWLAARGYIDRDSADHATGRAQDASHDLPVADRLGGLLHDVAERAPEIDIDALTIKTGSRITSRSATCSPVGSGSRAASGRSPSRARPAISHDRDGRYPSRRHGPRTAGTCSRSASSTPDPRHTGPDPRAHHAGRARLPARDRAPRRCSLSGWPAREARP